MENHSYVASNFGISLLYETETILIAYDYGYEHWRMVIVPVDGKGVLNFPLIPNIDPFIPLKKIKE